MGEVYHLVAWQHRRLTVHTSFQVSTLKSNTLKCTTFQPICCLSMIELTQLPTSFTVIRWSARDMCALEVLANSILYSDTIHTKAFLSVLTSSLYTTKRFDWPSYIHFYMLKISFDELSYTYFHALMCEPLWSTLEYFLPPPPTPVPVRNIFHTRNYLTNVKVQRQRQRQVLVWNCIEETALIEAAMIMSWMSWPFDQEEHCNNDVQCVLTRQDLVF